MSEVNDTAAPATAPAAPAAAPAAPAVPATVAAKVAPAAPKNSIQVLTEQLGGFYQQREKAIANVHAIDGAIQATQHLLGLLKAEAAKAITEVEKIATEVKTEVETVAGEVEVAVEGEAKKVEAKVVSIADAAKKAL